MRVQVWTTTNTVISIWLHDWWMHLLIITGCQKIRFHLNTKLENGWIIWRLVCNSDKIYKMTAIFWYHSNPCTTFGHFACHLRCHLNTKPFTNLTTFDHLNTRLVWFWMVTVYQLLLNHFQFLVASHIWSNVIGKKYCIPSKIK